jgi:hypothetical protein
LEILSLWNRQIDAVKQFRHPIECETTLEDDSVKKDTTSPVQSYSSTPQRDLEKNNINYIEPVVNVDHFELPIENATELEGDISSYESTTSVCVD